MTDVGLVLKKLARIEACLGDLQRVDVQAVERDIVVERCHGWLPNALVPTLHRMVGFRNVLVHGYDDVDLGIVRGVAERHGVDLQGFVDAIRARVSATGGLEP
jgi:hypothetical protein